MKDIRFNSISGIIEDVGRTSISLEFIEWWSKDGLDVTLYSPLDNETKSISLSRDELHAIVVASIAGNFIDVDSAKKEACDMKQESVAREDEYQKNIQEALPASNITGFGDLDKLSSF